MKHCKKCILNENYPGISFNESGICNFCQPLPSQDLLDKKKIKNKNKFLDLVKKHKGKSSYDCLVAYSGGKDSTFTLHLMKTKYNLNILAFSFDNWFQSTTALQNISRVIKNMDIDHMTFRPNFSVFKQMTQICLTPGFYSKKALERASAICTTCILQIRFIATKIAIEKAIPFVVFGLSPGQSPVSSSVFKNNSAMTKKMQDSIYQPMYEKIGEKIKPFFLEERHFSNKDNFPFSVNPLAFTDYKEDEIYKIVEKYGWLKPDDTDSNSTNCLLNGIANEIHLNQYGYHPYAYEMAGLVRSGCLTRDEALKRIEQQSDRKIVEKVGKDLGIEEYIL